MARLDTESQQADANAAAAAKKPAVNQPAAAAIPPFNVVEFFGTFMESLALKQQRQKKELEALKTNQETDKKLLDVSKGITDVRRQQADFAKPVIQEVMDLQAGEAEQERLLNSGSFTDFLAAKGNAILNPGRFTREGRAKRMAEASNELNLLNAATEAQINALKSEGDLALQQNKVQNAEYERIKVLEAHGNELLTAKTESYAMMSKTLLEQKQAKSIVLDTLSDEEVKSAYEASRKPDQKGQVNIGGFNFTLGEMESEQMNRRNREIALMTQEAAITTGNQKLALAAQEQIVRSLPTQVLAKWISTGSLDSHPDLKLIDPGMLSTVYAEKKAAEADLIQQEVNRKAFVDPTLVAGQQFDTLKRLETRAPLNSPLSAMIKQAQSSISLAAQRVADINAQNAKAAEEGKTSSLDTGKYVEELNTITAKAMEQVNLAARKQAKLMSNGDKHYEELMAQHLMGEPLDQASLESAISTRLKKNQPLTDVLPPAVAKLFKRNFDAIKAKKANALQTQGGFTTMDRTAQNEMDAEAVTEALEQSIAESTVGEIDKVVSQQTMAVGSPLRGLVNPQQMLTFQERADALGIADAARNLGIDQEGIEMLEKGSPVTVEGREIRPDQWRQMKFVTGQAHLLMQLDAVEPGLAEKFVNFWSGEAGDKYKQEYVQNYMGQTVRNGNLQAAAIVDLGAQSVYSQLNDYGLFVTAGAESYKSLRAERFKNFYSFGTDPSNRQAFLLQFTPDLANEEKTLIYREVIAPLIASAKEQNLDFNAANEFIDTQLMQVKSENPAIERALKKMRTGRYQAIEGMESVMDSPWGQGENRPVPDWMLPGLKASGAQIYDQNVPPGGLSFMGVMAPGRSELGERKNQVRFGMFESSNSWLGSQTKTAPYDWYRAAMQPKTNPRN